MPITVHALLQGGIFVSKNKKTKKKFLEYKKLQKLFGNYLFGINQLASTSCDWTDFFPSIF